MADTEQWSIVWFPPDAEMRERTYKTEKAARSFARGGMRDGYQVADWNPIMTRRIISTTEQVIPL